MVTGHEGRKMSKQNSHTHTQNSSLYPVVVFASAFSFSLIPLPPPLPLLSAPHFQWNHQPVPTVLRRGPGGRRGRTRKPTVSALNSNRELVSFLFIPFVYILRNLLPQKN